MRVPSLVPTTIGAKVAMGAAVISLLCVAVVTVLLLESIRDDFSRVLSAQQDSLVAHVAEDLDAKLAENLDVVRRYASLLTPDSLRSPDRLRALYEGDPAFLVLFDDVVVFDTTGQVVADVPALPGRTAVNIGDRPFFRRVLATGEAVISDPVLSKHDAVPIINMAAPVRDSAGRVAGVLVGALRLERPNVLGRLATEKIGRTGYFSLITKGDDSVYVVHPDASRILQPRSRFGATPAAATDSERIEGTVEGTNSAGVRALFSYRTLHTTNWLLMAALPTAEAFAPIQAAERRLMVFSLVLGVLVAVLVWVLVNAQLAPLTRLRDHMNAMRVLKSELAAPVERSDEIGDLAMAFNHLMDDRARATAALERQSQSLRLASKVFENTADAVVVSDVHDRVLMVNPAFTRMTGYTERDMVGKLLGESPFRPLDPVQSAQRMAEQRQKGYVNAEVVRYRKDGSELPLWVTASNVTDDQGRATHYVRVFTDISHLKESQRKLEALASSDSLTGVRNRRAFDEALQDALERFHDEARGFTVLFVDLDAFKEVNDALGHARGDELLKIVAGRLQSCVRAGDTLCRLGGDEFGVLLGVDADEADAERVARRMLAACAQPFALDGTTVEISASIGIARCPQDATDAMMLLRIADGAMYAAKRAGGGRFTTGPLTASAA